MSGAGRTTADPDTKSTITRPEETGGTERRPARSRIGKILVLSIWEDTWSLGEGSGVADEVEFIRHLVERGIELHFLIPEPAGSTTSRVSERLFYHTYPNIFRKYERAPTIMKRLVWPASFRGAVAEPLRNLAREIEPDILLGFSHYSLWPLSRLGGELGIPTAVKLFGVMDLGRLDMPGWKYWWKNFEQISALRHPVDRYIVLNDGTMGDRALERLGVPTDRISFLPNGIDVEWAHMDIDRSEARRDLGLPEDKILIVTYSRLVSSKRVDLFLKAASGMAPEVLDRIGIIVGGDGPERANLENLARELDIADRTVFTGAIPYDGVPRLLKASDIFVGTNELTNMSLPPCEAILCGVPVVAFDNSGTSEVVREGETGLLVRDGDVRHLTRRLEEIIVDDGLRERLSRQAAAFGRGYFIPWEERISHEIEILEKLLD